MNRIEVSTGHESEILLKVESDIITPTLHIVQLLVSYSFYKIKIKFAAYHIVTKILSTDAYIHFIISDYNIKKN
jgi:hypothetical protein